jgi:small-conductance mechanosensitive channel
MEIATDNLIARVLLTLNTLGYSLGPAIADFNRTHATNPLWTPHARFHVVWQVLSYCGVGLISLWLIWSVGTPLKLWLAVALAVAIYAGFFATVFSMPRYGGSVADTNGVPPIATVNLAGKPLALDTNVTVFCVQVALLLVAALTIR